MAFFMQSYLTSDFNPLVIDIQATVTLPVRCSTPTSE
jgi:hypothetical protein